MDSLEAGSRASEGFLLQEKKRQRTLNTPAPSILNGLPGASTSSNGDEDRLVLTEQAAREPEVELLTPMRPG
eukprot:1796599-Prorocentrum_lima.AAC.1